MHLAEEEVLVPGLVDIHCHGAFGVDFSTANANEARQAIRKLHAAGSTTLVASLVTAAPDILIRQLDMLADLVDEGLLAGLHLEGPFLAEARCGAQNPRWLREPDLVLTQSLISSARGHLTTMTYAPELPGADELVRLLVHNDVVPSLGHTACSPLEANHSLSLARQQLSARSGTKDWPRPTVTHLFNAMEPLHHRSPGALPACLRAARAGNAVVELIADNTHLHPDIVATMFELLGAANIALVTDSMAAAGLHDGLYRLGPTEVIVQDGVARVAETGAIAGGTASMLDLLRNTTRAGVTLDDAVTAAAHTPGNLLSRAPRVGQLRENHAADLLILDANLEPDYVMRQGQWVGRQPGESASPHHGAGYAADRP
ncbi:amidohydrolase family protein [Arthrobacter sp. Soc17.1.1.1]|uniref:N-acetylglucosamine-6-phosphate deacetylase n=1 Tax=Arthrobacter sp. Soc17.1.1.1 TaxID=3121277 RepID=UPI002FE4CF3A